MQNLFLYQSRSKNSSWCSPSLALPRHTVSGSESGSGCLWHLGYPLWISVSHSTRPGWGQTPATLVTAVLETVLYLEMIGNLEGRKFCSGNLEKCSESKGRKQQHLKKGGRGVPAMLLMLLGGRWREISSEDKCAPRALGSQAGTASQPSKLLTPVSCEEGGCLRRRQLILHRPLPWG